MINNNNDDWKKIVAPGNETIIEKVYKEIKS